MLVSFPHVILVLLAALLAQGRTLNTRGAAANGPGSSSARGRTPERIDGLWECLNRSDNDDNFDAYIACVSEENKDKNTGKPRTYSSKTKAKIEYWWQHHSKNMEGPTDAGGETKPHQRRDPGGNGHTSPASNTPASSGIL